MKIICILKAIYYWFRYMPANINGEVYTIDYHFYILQDDGSLKCKHCGKVSK